MPRVKKYIDSDVLTEARKRIEHIYELFDSVVLMYSGGKDSSVCLQLMKEHHEKHGLGPVEAVFKDEEFLPTDNIKFLEEIRHEPWLNLHWLCYRWTDERHIMGSYRTHIRWDPDDHELPRPQPEWAETLADFGYPEDLVVGGAGGQGADIDIDDLVASRYPGAVAFITGVRASESLVRYRSVVNKLNENYICRIEGNPRSAVRLCKPIYDWQENDVLKYMKDTGFPLCTFYDSQEVTGTSLRIGPPLGMASKRISNLRESDPELFEGILQTFPEMAIQDRYASEFDKKAMLEKYGDGFNGVLRYIRDHVPDGPIKEKARKRYSMYKAMHDNRPEEFPASELLKAMVGGARERKVRGIDIHSKANKKKASK